jgi:hypothetical protein
MTLLPCTSLSATTGRIAAGKKLQWIVTALAEQFQGQWPPEAARSRFFDAVKYAGKLPGPGPS